MRSSENVWCSVGDRVTMRMWFEDEHMIEEMIFVRVIEEKMRICDGEDKLTRKIYYNWYFLQLSQLDWYLGVCLRCLRFAPW